MTWRPFSPDFSNYLKHKIFYSIHPNVNSLKLHSQHQTDIYSKFLTAFPDFPSTAKPYKGSKLADDLVAVAARGMAAVVPIPADSFKLGFIGAGKMAESIARGVVNSGLVPASQISTAPRSSSRRDAFQSFGVQIFESNQKVVENSDVVVFSVKPQVVENVVLELRPLLTKKKLLVSVAAGVKLKSLQEWAGHGRFIRVMPNTPAAVGKAATVLSLGQSATEEDGGLIARLFGAIGKVWRTDEKYFDAVTGLSGSGPAYIFMVIEALADGGVAAGLPRELARDLASQTVLGAAEMTVRSGKHPGQLKDDVASPGGTTIAGIHELEKGGIRGIVMNAVVAATKRSLDLSPS